MERTTCPHCGHLHVFPVDRDACQIDVRARRWKRRLIALVVAAFAAYLITEMYRAHRTFGTWRCAFEQCEPLPMPDGFHRP